MSDSLLSPPRIAFLGVCERAALVREGHQVLWRHNLLGLRQTLVNYFYPCGAPDWHIVFACYDPVTLGGARLRLVDESGDELFTMDLRFEERVGELADLSASEQREWRFVGLNIPNWYLFHQPLIGLVVRRPGTVKVLFKGSDANEEVCIGGFYCVVANPPPLTQDRIAAIRADPKAGKYVRAVVGCKKCQGKLYVVAGIDRPSDIDGKEKIWYQEAPNEWRCNCGLSIIDLKLIRQNLHGLLGKSIKNGEAQSELTFIRMYEKGTLADVCAEFGAILDGNPAEQDVQRFLEGHTVFLHRFSPTKIKPKAPILTKYQTDFAIVDSRGVLILVELEKPGIKLLKKNGDISQDLQHAFDQVRTWLHEIQRHWTAALDCMGFKEDEIAGVRGVVVAGRDRGYPSKHLMRLKGTDHGQVDFYTYDDLLEDTVNLTREID